jgi:hypothetical protein
MVMVPVMVMVPGIGNGDSGVMVPGGTCIGNGDGRWSVRKSRARETRISSAHLTRVVKVKICGKVPAARNSKTQEVKFKFLKRRWVLGLCRQTADEEENASAIRDKPLQQ